MLGIPLFIAAFTAPRGSEVRPIAAYRPIVEAPLELNLARIAARGVSPANWQAQSIPAGDRSAWPIADWVLADLPEADSVQQLKRKIERVGAGSPGSFVSPVFVGTDGGPVFITPTLLVAFDAEHGRAAARAAIGEFDTLRILQEDWASMPGSYKLAVDASNGFQVLELALALASQPGVLYAEPDWIFTGRGSYVPNDPLFPEQWGLHNTGQQGGRIDMDMNLPAAWDITSGDPSIKILVIDTGVQQDHPDIQQLPGADLTDQGPGNGGPVNSFDNHGTPVAGCVSAVMDNGIGVVGVAPRCQSVSARTFIAINSAGSWTTQSSWTVEALAFAESIGARVTNNSNGYGFVSKSINNKYLATRAGGMVHFASAGNAGTGTMDYPASLTSTVSVGAINRSGALTNFSNFGPGLDFVAPGRKVYTTDRTGAAGWTAGGYIQTWGTSFASPLSAGVAALVLSRNPALGAQDVELVLRTSVKDLGAPGFDETFGWGLPDAHAALLLSDPSTITSYCLGDGSGTACPCLDFGGTGEGCANSTGSGSLLSGSGGASTSNDTLVLTITNSTPSAPGLLFQGSQQLAGGSGIAVGNGLLCLTSQKRWSVQVATTSGTASYGAGLLGSDPAAVPGATLFYQWWYRDNAGACGNGFNFSNGLSVTWQ